MYSDLDDFLADLDARKLLARVGEPVSPDLEIAAVTDRACKIAGRRPGAAVREAGRLRHAGGQQCVRIDWSACASRSASRRSTISPREIDELMTPQMPEGIMDALKMLPMVGRLRDLMPKTVKDAPCQEVVRRDGTLDELPILKCWPEDGGRFITLPLVFTKDPETGDAEHRHLSHAGVRRPHDRHALAAAQGRRAAPPRRRAARASGSKWPSRSVRSRC